MCFILKPQGDFYASVSDSHVSKSNADVVNVDQVPNKFFCSEIAQLSRIWHARFGCARLTSQQHNSPSQDSEGVDYNQRVANPAQSPGLPLPLGDVSMQL